jgi:uncharacterized protein (DUF169 family)
MGAYADSSSSLSLLNLIHSPVAVAFLSSPPAGVPKISKADAASCGYWRQASEGKAFYTDADDHLNCPVGAFTHGAPMSPEKGQELQGLIGTMIELKYLQDDEVPVIPHRTDQLKIAAYAPLTEATFQADVVIFRGNTRQIMLVSEAARRAGVFEGNAPMGRPACAMLPQSIGSASGVVSVGCIGNRVYTGLADDELYFAVPGAAVARLLGEVETIVRANAELEKFHRARAATLGA